MKIWSSNTRNKRKNSNKKSRVSRHRIPRFAESRAVTAEREVGRMSLDENFGTRSLRGRPRLVNAAGDGKSSRESELSAVANNARRDEGIVEFTPRGVHSTANIQSPVHSPLWNGNGNGRGGGRGAPSITWEIALALFMCVYTDTSRALGHATPRRATPRRTLCYATPCHAASCRAAVLRSGYR